MVGTIYSQETRNLFFKLYNLKVPVKTISIYLEIPIRTLYRWINQGVYKPINPTRISNKNKYQYLYKFITTKISEYNIIRSLNITYKKGSKFYIESDVNKQKIVLSK